MTQMFERVVVPIGGTDREFLAQEHAVELAAEIGAPVYAVHVAPDPAGAMPEVFDHIAQVCDRHGVALTRNTVAGASVVEELTQEARPRDLVVVGTRRMGGTYRLGSIAAELIAVAEAPVHVVRLDP